MKRVNYCIRLAIFVLPIYGMAQCELFKSEIEGVEKYVATVKELADQVQSYADTAAFAAQYSEAKSNANKAKIDAGEILSAAYEAVELAAEAQYYSGVCGIEDVKSYAIDAERLAVDVRDFADEAYTNAKKATTARNLGDVRFYMRKALDATKEAQRAAEAAAYAAADANYSCSHQDTAVGGND